MKLAHIHLCYDFSGNCRFVGRLQMDRWTLNIFIHKLIFFACARVFHHITDTDEMNSLDLCLFFSFHLRGVTQPESCESCHFLAVILISCLQRWAKVVSNLHSDTHIYIDRAAPFGSSVSDFRVNKTQCGERYSVFCLLIGVSRTCPCDI